MSRRSGRNVQMTVSRMNAQLGVAGAIILGCAVLPGYVAAQQSAEPAAVPADAGAPPAPVAGIWGGAETVEAVSAAACFNEAADVGGGRVSERTDVYGRKGGERWIAFEQDCGIRNRGRVNKPTYKQIGRASSRERGCQYV